MKYNLPGPLWGRQRSGTGRDERIDAAGVIVAERVVSDLMKAHAAAKVDVARGEEITALEAMRAGGVQVDAQHGVGRTVREANSHVVWATTCKLASWTVRPTACYDIEVAQLARRTLGTWSRECMRRRAAGFV